MNKNIVIDDYGRTPKISEEILKIIEDIKIIDEVSVIVGFIENSLHKKLRETNVKTSLHLNLTDNVKIKNIKDGNLSFIKLLFLPTKNRKFIYEEIDKQIKAYSIIYNLNYIDINGHEHVHTIPWIYNYLLRKENIKNIRYSSEKFYFVIKKINPLKLFRNYIAFLLIKILNFSNKTKSNKKFFGVIYSNYMCEKVYKKIINLNQNSNIQILYHPGKASKNENNFFSKDYFFKYFTSDLREKEKQELYEIKKNLNNY
tara:strand:- start:9021 stop:9791 length:771 start_codon:yes stop_codon:yes gene_type:complete